jgi:hypothetical protein
VAKCLDEGAGPGCGCPRRERSCVDRLEMPRVLRRASVVVNSKGGVAERADKWDNEGCN